MLSDAIRSRDYAAKVDPEDDTGVSSRYAIMQQSGRIFYM